MSDAVTRLLAAPYGHSITRDKAGHSRVSLFAVNDGRLLVTMVAPTFDQAVARALDAAEQEVGG